MPSRPHKPEPSPRPRPRKQPPEPRKQEVPDSNGTQPVVVAPELRRLTRAIEELHAAAREMKLPPISIDWQKDPDADTTQQSSELRADYERIQRKFKDLEGIGSGPMPPALAEHTAPDDADAWLVEGFIRPGTIVMLTGVPGVAKSWIALQLALVAGAGRTFLDHYPVSRPLNVLLLDEDNGDREAWRREEKLLAFLDLQRAGMTNVSRLSLAGVELDSEYWQTWLRGLILGMPLDLIILDPISEMHGGKELRDDDHFRSLLRFLKQIKVDYPDLAMVLVHHNRKRAGNEKGAPSSIEDVRGQWGQTPDVVAIVRTLGERRIHWQLLKRVPHSALILEQQESGGLTVVADETTSQTRRASTDGKVLGAIDSGARTAEELILGTGLSKAGVYKALQRLHAAGLISKRAPYERVRDSDDPVGGFDEPPE